MKNWKSIIGQLLPYLILIGLGSFVLNQHFPDFFKGPNQWLLNDGGDGLHNYFTFAYYLKFDTGTRFTGMTYPFGEHQLFTDGHFLLGWILQKLGFSGADNAAGIIHVFMYLGFVLGLVFSYKILRFYRLDRWFAILIACIICLLSPQLHRFSAHYSLGQIGFIPMLWYSLLYASFIGKRWWIWVFPVVLILFYGLIHPYYFPMGFFFMGSYWGIATLANLRKWTTFKPQFWGLLGALILTAIIFVGFTSLTDPVSDRHPAPFGLFYYHASFESVFLPSFGPFLELWQDMTTVKLGEPLESWNYVGMIGFFMLIFLFFRLVIRMVRKPGWTAFRFTTHQSLQYLLLASIPILLIATCWPFKPFPVVLDWFPFLRQFRSLGRFGWMFYYVFTVFSAVYLFNVSKSLSRKGNKNVAFSMLALVVLIWGLEAIINIQTAAEKINQLKAPNHVFRKSNTDYSGLLEDAGFDTNDFQAALFFPYYNNGSEKLYIERSGLAKQESYKFAFDTGIPLINLHSPRTSMSQAFGLAQLLSSPMIEKTVQDTLAKDGRPILLVSTKETMRPDEQRLLDRSDLILENQYIRLAQLPIEAFDHQKEEAIAEFEEIQANLIQKEQLLLSDSTDFLLYQSFDNDASTYTFASPGAFDSKGQNGSRLLIHQFDLDSLQTFEISAWIHSNPKVSAFPALFFKVYDQNTKALLQTYVYNPKNFVELYQNWSRVSIVADLGPNQYFTVEMLHENLKLRRVDNVIDELLIRPIDVDVYRENKNTNLLIKNNYVLRDSE